MLKALVLEDDAWIVPIIECALTTAIPDLKIDRVESYEDAVQHARGTNYDIIIADIFVNGAQDGLIFWDYCRAMCPDVAILLTSSMTIEEFHDRFRGKREDPLYIRKPLRINELTRTVQAMLDFSGVSS